VLPKARGIDVISASVEKLNIRMLPLPRTTFSLNVSSRVVLVSTLVDPLAGVFAVSVGAVSGGGAVVKLQLLLEMPGKLLEAASLKAPLSILIYTLRSAGSVEEGVMIACAPVIEVFALLSNTDEIKTSFEKL
jgi:hypothetical protein